MKELSWEKVIFIQNLHSLKMKMFPSFVPSVVSNLFLLTFPHYAGFPNYCTSSFAIYKMGGRPISHEMLRWKGVNVLCEIAMVASPIAPLVTCTTEIYSLTSVKAGFLR